MSTEPTNKQNSGFTLLELIISLTILSVIVVLIFGAFRIGVRAWEKGEKDVETRQRYRIVLNLLQHQLSSVCLRKIQNNGKQVYFLKGDDKSVVFLSHVSLIPGNTVGMVYVRYAVESQENDKEQLMVYEKNEVLMENLLDTDDVSENDFHELIPEAGQITFGYLYENRQTREISWQDNWDSEIYRSLPLAVKVSLEKDPETAPLVVIARMQK